jgi:cobalt/nickel transport system ATP-binding protein
VTVSSVADELLVLDRVSYAYLERFVALDDVSLTIRRGERIALLGANGCGKSTLLKVLDGLVFPDAGSYLAFGAAVTEEHLEDEQFNRGFRGRVGFIFQNTDAQIFSASVREEIAFGPLSMGMSREQVDARVADTLEMLDITDLADRPPYQLSGGQKKRVAIASVLVMNPEVLLFDEPTAALDPRTQQWLIELIAQLGHAGKTIVLATHDLDTVDVLAERCVVLSEHHRLMADGPPAKLLADTDLLLGVNLIHEHAHRHGAIVHGHVHRSGHHGEEAPATRSARLAQCDDRFDLDRDVARELGGADGRARAAPTIGSVDRDDEVGEPVDDLGLIREAGRGADEPGHLHEAFDRVE